ncbi:alpha/beta hydrolase [Methylobacterium sp. NEAU 140]|uniref:alpha/beta hydrolase n=1 Tax=Methylobacterium sp. NEAU 140 TaxID=3064945 RepID=UPI002733866F|nr:alpha/beta hydrolase [Methylobacterium sp. NEAU 140]MDP4026511.1 alpha/beta hydrolase [Methylobacterium sp. NEAU 140]
MPDRRSILLSLAAAATFSAPAQALGAPVRLPLWPDWPPGGGGPHGPFARDDSGAVSNVATPVIEVFSPSKPNGVAMLVLGGGGYTRIGIVKEAFPAAFWLASEGITAFVLTYRLPMEGWDDGPIVSLQDGQRAVRVIRANAERFRIDPNRLGVMGFSAGGHLAGMIAARSAFRSYPRVDAVDELSARPDFANLIYPVVSLQPPFDRTQTRRSLVGENPTPAASEEWSLQTYIRAGMPKLFLVQADDDRVISPENSRVLDEACRGAGVPVEYHRFAVGGHGFGIGRSEAPVALWPRLCRLWLTSVSVLT